MDYLKAAVALIGLLRELVDWIKEMTKEDPAQWIKDTAAVFADVRKAKSVEEKTAAAIKLRDLLNKL